MSFHLTAMLIKVQIWRELMAWTGIILNYLTRSLSQLPHTNGSRPRLNGQRQCLQDHGNWSCQALQMLPCFMLPSAALGTDAAVRRAPARAIAAAQMATSDHNDWTSPLQFHRDIVLIHPLLVSAMVNIHPQSSLRAHRLRTQAPTTKTQEVLGLGFASCWEMPSRSDIIPKRTNHGLN